MQFIAIFTISTPTGPKIPSSTDIGGRGNIQNLNAAIGGGTAGQVWTAHTAISGIMPQRKSINHRPDAHTRDAIEKRTNGGALDLR